MNKLPKRDSRGRFLPSYESYVKQYKEKKAKLAKRGEEMAEGMYTRREWEADVQYYRDRPKKYKLSINQYLVDRQTYSLSREQLSAYLNSIDFEPMEYVSKHSEVEMRKKLGMGGDRYAAFMEEVSENYHALRGAGLTAAEASLLISQQYFGSP